MKALLKSCTMVFSLAAATSVCAQEGYGVPYAYRPYYSGEFQDGGAMSVVIEGRSYRGNALRLDTPRGAVYQAILQSTGGGGGLRCQLVDDGRRRISGTCIDESQKAFEVQLPRRDFR